MKLENKKELIARTLNVGKGRITFNTQRLSEIKEAITKQDIRDLKEQGVILIKEVKGRRKKQERKTRRRKGSFRKNVANTKQLYVIMTRKLRSYVRHLKLKGLISTEEYHQLRKEIRTNSFKSLSRFKERVAQLRSKE